MYQTNRNATVTRPRTIAIIMAVILIGIIVGEGVATWIGSDSHRTAYIVGGAIGFIAGYATARFIDWVADRASS